MHQNVNVTCILTNVYQLINLNRIGKRSSHLADKGHNQAIKADQDFDSSCKMVAHVDAM